MAAARQVAVAGGGDPGSELAEAAREVGRLLAEAGATVVCGGLGGTMEAAAQGAAEEGGDVIGILPGDDPAAANPHVSHAVATGVGHARNLAVAASAEALIAIGGEWGTLSEIAFARRLGRRVVALGSWSLKPAGELAESDDIAVATDPAEAVRLALGR